MDAAVIVRHIHPYLFVNGVGATPGKPGRRGAFSTLATGVS
jgi:hypothetical protein